MRLLLDMGSQARLLSMVGGAAVLLGAACVVGTWKLSRADGRATGAAAVAFRRWARAILGILTATSALVVPVVGVWLVQDARTTIVVHRTNLSAPVTNQIGLLSTSLLWALPSWLTALVAVLVARRATAAEERNELRRARIREATMFIVLGLMPLVAGAVTYDLMLRAAQLHSASLAPELKPIAMLQALLLAREKFGAWVVAAMVGCAATAVLTIALLVKGPRAGAPVPSPIGSTSRCLAWSAVCLLGAAGCVVLARPYRAENRMAWPEPVLGCWSAPSLSGLPGAQDARDGVSVLIAQDSLAAWIEIPTCRFPSSAGERLLPDVWVERQGVRVRGVWTSDEKLGDVLTSARHSGGLLFPGEAGHASLWAPPMTPRSRVSQVLADLRAAGFTEVSLGCGRLVMHSRPTFGRLARACPNAVPVKLRADPGAEPFTGIRPELYPSYHQMLEVAAEAVAAGKHVVVAVSPADVPSVEGLR